MEEGSKLVSLRIQKEIAYDVIIDNYNYLVGHVDAVRIFPQLVSSRLVEPDFRQRLDCKQTDRDKMMALLHELVRCTEETWFDGFTNALSKAPQYEKVADKLLKDYAKTLAERLANPKVEDASTDMSFLSNETGPVVNVTVSGVDEVMKKAMEDAQAAMKKATEDHKTALSELKKANDRVFEAEKSKVYDEAEKRVLEERVRKADDKLRKAEVHNRLLEKEAQSYKDAVEEVEQKMEKLEKNMAEQTEVQERQEKQVRALEGELAEARQAKEKMDDTVKGLKEELEKNRTEQAEAKERQEQKVSGLTKELETAISDRNSLEKKCQEAGKEMERVRSELVQTQAEWEKLEALYKAVEQKLKEETKDKEDVKKQ